MSLAVYVQTNDATENEVIAFSRAEDGALTPLGRYSTAARSGGGAMIHGGAGTRAVRRL